MKKNILLIIFMFTILFAFADDFHTESFNNAVKNYKERKFDEALQDFVKIENEGIENDELFVNIGNCYFRLDQLGMSILYYKKAVAINPNNDKAKINLNYAKSLTVDVQKDEEHDFLTKILIKTYNSLSLNMLAILSILFFAVIVFIINFIIFKYRGREKTLQYFFLIIALLFFTFSFGLGMKKWNDVRHQKEAVLIVDSAIGFSGPGADFTRVFTIHEGNIFEIVRNQDDWTLVQLKSGLGGWIQNNSFKSIKAN